MKKFPEKQSYQRCSDHFKYPPLGIMGFQKEDKSCFNFYTQTHTVLQVFNHPDQSYRDSQKRKIYTLILYVIYFPHPYSFSFHIKIFILETQIP